MVFAEITEIVEAIDGVLSDMPAAEAMTVLDTLVAIVIARHDLPQDVVIAKHSANIPVFVSLFRGENQPGEVTH